MTSSVDIDIKPLTIDGIVVTPFIQRPWYLSVIDDHCWLFPLPSTSPY